MRALSLLCCSILLISAAQAEMSFKASVDKLQAAYEDKIQLQLEVVVSDPTVKTTPIPPPDIIGFKIGGSGSSVERLSDRVVRKYTYELVPARSGSVTIPALKVEFQSAAATDTLLSEPITLNIAQPIPVSAPGSYKFFLYLIGAVVIIGVVGFGLWKRRSQESVPVEVDWRTTYLDRFTEIKKIADRQDFRTFSTEVFRLIVSIIEHNYEIKLAGFTAADTLRWLAEKNVDQGCQNLCKELFDFCESVKFSTGKVDLLSGVQAVSKSEKIVELLLK